METIITKSQVADAVYAAIPKLACVLPADIEAGLAVARELEGNPRGRAVLDQLIENAAIAAEDRVPICQDTGTVWVSLEIGPDVAVRGDVFADVDDAVARARRACASRWCAMPSSTARTRATTRLRSATSIPWTSRARRGCTLC